MRKILAAHAALLVTSAIGTTALAADPGLQAGTYQIDPAHTYAHFTVDHMGLSTMQGRMVVKKGTLNIAQDRSDSQVQVVIDPASVDTGDSARDEHLRDMDGFFDVSKYPQMTFKSTSITFDEDDDDEAKLMGDLTMHGVTKPVALEVEDMQCRINPLDKTKYTCGFSAETTVKRSDFGMDAYSALVGNDIGITLEVEADKPVDSAS